MWENGIGTPFFFKSTKCEFNFFIMKQLNWQSYRLSVMMKKTASHSHFLPKRDRYDIFFCEYKVVQNYILTFRYLLLLHLLFSKNYHVRADELERLYGQPVPEQSFPLVVQNCTKYELNFTTIKQLNLPKFVQLHDRADSVTPPF